MYEPEEIVTLSAARGGWRGVISQVKSVGSKTAYLIWGLDYNAFQRDAVIVLEDDIASSQGFDYPAWEVGQSVTLYQLTGEIEAIDGTEIHVRVEQKEKHYTKSRLHIVPRWRLLIENH